MKKDVTNADLMQAIIDLSNTQKQFSIEQQKTNEKIDQLDKKVSKINQKLEVLTSDLLNTRADVRELQKIN